jgi:hypothetical protein
MSEDPMLDYRLLFVETLGEHDLDVLTMLDDDSGSSEDLRRSLSLNPESIESYLTDSRLFELLFESAEADGIRVLTPHLAFAVLVHRTIRDLDSSAYVPEWVGVGERLPVFDVVSLSDFIEDTTRRFMVIELLASFTRVASGSMWVRTRRGYRRRRYSELDPVSLAEMVESLPVERRAAGYRRLGDVALFLTGVFPDHTARHPMSVMGRARLASATGIVGDFGAGVEYVRFLETAGRRWYDRASDGSLLPLEGRRSLKDFAANFTQARRFLNYVADTYLHRFDTGLMNPVA